MVRFLLLFLILYFTQPSFGQQEEKKVFFSEALSQHLPDYEKKQKRLMLSGITIGEGNYLILW